MWRRREEPALDRETVDGIIRKSMEIDEKLIRILVSLRWTMAKRKRMTPEERREYDEQKARWAENDRDFRALVARREQRLREWDEYVARRRARLRRLTFGLLGR